MLCTSPLWDQNINNSFSKLFRGYSGFPVRLWWCTAAGAASSCSNVQPPSTVTSPEWTSLSPRRLAGVAFRLVLCILRHLVEGSHPLRISDRYAAIFWIRRPLQHPCMLADRGCFAFHGHGTVRAAGVWPSGCGFVGQCESTQFFNLSPSRNDGLGRWLSHCRATTSTCSQC
jgi:hypothetical protein